MADLYRNLLWSDRKRTFFGLPWSFTRYYLTTTHLITRIGFLNIKEDEIELYRVIDKRIEQPLSKRIFHCGTVIIHSRDADTPEKKLIAVKYPHEVANLISENVRRQQEQYGIVGRDMMGVSVAHAAPQDVKCSNCDETIPAPPPHHG